MQVVKRDGTIEEFNFAKIENCLVFAGLTPEEIAEFRENIDVIFHNKMSSLEIHRVVTQYIVEKIGPHTSKNDKKASKLYLFNLIKEASINRNYTGLKYGSFYSFIKEMVTKGFYHSDLIKKFTKEEIEELGSYIVSDRDYLFPYAGIKLLTERYLVKGFNKEIYELPQELYMCNAMALYANEKFNRIQYIKKLYDTTSLHDLTQATPMFANSRKPLQQESSCYIITVADSLEGINNANANAAMVSKFGGGLGLSVSHIRASGSPIQGFKNLSTNIISWLKGFNNTALTVDQLGSRKGAFAAYLDVWHKDFLDFLQLKNPTGDPRMRCYDMFTGAVFNDVFMKQLTTKNGKYYLFCPHEIKLYMGFDLLDYSGEEFEKKYWECVANPELPRDEIKAMDVAKALIQATTETGTPYLMFRDICNKMNPNKHAGKILSSNVCSEILQNNKANGPVENIIEKDELGNEYVVQKRQSGDTVICNLSSLNLGNIYNDDKKLKETIEIAIRMMDNAIDINFSPIPEVEISNKKMRSVGLGVSNYHYMLAKENIAWDSQEHLDFVDKLFEKINFYAIQASMELAKERGAYPLFQGSDWDNGDYFKLRNYTSPEWLELAEKVHKYGIRNSHLLAIAPTASTSVIIGSTAGIDPIFSKFFLERKKNGDVPIFPPEIDDLWWHYTEAHNVSQEWSIRSNAVRARHIDQSQSMNLYISTTTTATEILKLYILAWKLGVKTLYYTRSRSTEVEDCLSCSA